MRKNKKNWEIFSKSVKNNAIVCDHIPTTPALITTTNNIGDSMNNVSEYNNLVKTLRNDPNGFVIFGDFVVRYCKIDNSLNTNSKNSSYREYLVYENVADNSMSLEQIEVAQ
jgi:hypothetical protein